MKHCPEQYSGQLRSWYHHSCPTSLIRIFSCNLNIGNPNPNPNPATTTQEWTTELQMSHLSLCFCYLVDHISVGQVGHGHPSVTPQCHVNGVIVRAMRLLVQMDQLSYDV